MLLLARRGERQPLAFTFCQHWPRSQVLFNHALVLVNRASPGKATFRLMPVERLVSLGTTRQVNGTLGGGRNSLLESAQEATITSLAISAIQGQTRVRLRCGSAWPFFLKNADAQVARELWAEATL